MKKPILVVDDESNMRKIISAMIRREGFETIQASDGLEAVKILSSNEISVVVADLKMPGMNGLELSNYITKNHNDIPVIIVTAYGTIDSAVNAVKSGVFDYITKPFEQEEIVSTVTKAYKTYNANKTNVRDLGEGKIIIGQHPKMEQVFNIIKKVADTKSTVLITGESGTGKELIASALHDQSSRKSHPFIKINCAAIPSNLMESELFGYEKGAFTGAVSNKPGRFELAQNGTLFLDEIAEIPIEMQVKLLRTLQEGEFERVGGLKTIKMDVRLITATNRNLLEEIANNRFREDLYYRLNVVPVNLPSLKERSEDIPLLIKYFIIKFNERLDKNIKGFTQKAENILCGYNWPGNIRELENIVERLILFSDTDFIDVDDLPHEINNGKQTAILQNDLDAQKDGKSLKEIVKKATSKLEVNLIKNALEETGGNVTKAAKLLQISRKSLQLKMKELGLRNN